MAAFYCGIQGAVFLERRTRLQMAASHCGIQESCFSQSRPHCGWRLSIAGFRRVAFPKEEPHCRWQLPVMRSWAGCIAEEQGLLLKQRYKERELQVLVGTGKEHRMSDRIFVNEYRAFLYSWERQYCEHISSCDIIVLQKSLGKFCEIWVRKLCI